MTQERGADGRFKPGSSGNPAGRKPRETEQYFKDLFRDCISDADFKAVIEAMVKAAKKGNTSAAKMLMDYLMGPPVQKSEISGEGGGPLIIEYVNDWRKTS